MDTFEGLMLQTLTKEHIQEFVQFVYEAFLFGNQQFPKSNEVKELFNDISRHHAIIAIQAAQHINAKRGTNTKFNTFVRKEGKMICSNLSCEAHYFFKQIVPQKPKLKMYLKFPINDILNTTRQFQGLVSMRGAIKGQFQSSGLFHFNGQLRKQALLSDGYYYSYAVSLNPKVIGFAKKYGMQIIHTFTQPIFGKQREGYIIKFDLAKAYTNHNSSL